MLGGDDVIHASSSNLGADSIDENDYGSLAGDVRRLKRREQKEQER